MIWSLIVGGVIGWLAGAILGRDVPGGIIGNIVAGLVGSWLGNSLPFVADLGPSVGGMVIIPTLIGAILVIVIFSWIAKTLAK
ncbi:GlsB/YeaQ/YmgE family stress response membrane protein [Aerococcus kribbianus]|uniref:GlsB/YeaQ/YmgE family stress response membrane protein n=1 Tax=Aerococcus kribbianus TaxID=2999064 RepID=A0A9X3FVH8_9LACT|nr:MULTISPECIES: GlsB/YeaQ/YmgE family stress response membrane protein [unclassified Aerococcus]MCZ0717701.1 GlsB/YeaQ/YmgE family stress response membrane protein [Aerococcus sp. YH-aer221]MCZ0725989.1 GlsB/YeaQ/YmgE family stress response membrane protein [Aerococcus sp. YH-aer222]